MRSVLVFLTNFWWLAIPVTILQTFRHADWGTARKHGLAGFVAEAVRSLLGTNCWVFYVPLDSDWCGAEISRLLKRHGVRSWAYGPANGELFFRVRATQAAWAQYLLLREGVPLNHGLFAEKSAAGARRDPGAPAQERSRAQQPPSGATRLLESVDDYLVSLSERINSLL